MNEPDLILLRHMLDAAEEAVAIAGGRSRTESEGDGTAALAVIKDIEIIGEAASKLCADLRESEAGIP